MKTSHILRVKELFLAVIDLPEEQRDAYLAAQCRGDDALRVSVEALLDQDSGIVWWASFSQDGERVVTGSEDRTARVWIVDTEVLKELAATRLKRRSFSDTELEPYRELLGR